MSSTSPPLPPEVERAGRAVVLAECPHCAWMHNCEPCMRVFLHSLYLSAQVAQAEEDARARKSACECGDPLRLGVVHRGEPGPCHEVVNFVREIASLRAELAQLQEISK